jgi:non-ribosomal peptide synthetase-like protein
MTSTIEPRRTAVSRLDEFFARSVARRPEAIALEIPPAPGRPQRTRVSYRELDDRANLLADRLGPEAPGGIVAILLPRTTEWLYGAQLAVLRSGAAYLCIDPAFPDARVQHILHDSGATALITDDAGHRRATAAGYTDPVIRVDQSLDAGNRQGTDAPPHRDGPAYVIYTSGTTGQPKGVLVGHRGICGLIGADVTDFGLRPTDRIAQGSSAAYDSSVEELWMAFAAGATAVVMDDDTVRLGPDLVRWLRDEEITVLCPPPTLLRATGCADPETQLPYLRLVYVGGEALSPDVVDQWARGRRMVNGYGPTECTVTCLRHDVAPGQRIAIGRPVPGMRAWVLDDRLRPVPDGQLGELCMGGDGVALGYLRRPELTEMRFVEHTQFGRLYRTGDLVHAEPDGTLYYHGRIDSQVKLRGYRIELEEIETALARCSGVREAACRVQGEGAGQVLAAHVVAEDPEHPPRSPGLREQLQRSLPGYMVPTLFAVLDELPRGTSGKLRRTELPKLAPAQRQDKPAPPNTDVEKRILEAFRGVLAAGDDIGIDDDFFQDLGGSSLQAGMLVSKLRTDTRTASITVRDVYQARTVRELAVRAAPADAMPEVVAATPKRSGTAVVVTAMQAAWLLLELMAVSVAGYLVFFVVLPWLYSGIGLIPLLILAPFLAIGGRALLSPLVLLLAVTAKKLLIGRFRPMRVPVWSSLYVRIWIVQQILRFVPWNTIAGTELQCSALRALGARIGKRVHIHQGVNLVQGGWDLLDLGDDVTLSQDATLGLVELDAGELVFGSVTMASGSTLDVRAGAGPNTRVGRNSSLSPLSSLPAGCRIPDGEQWDGVPAHRVGPAASPPVPSGGQLSPRTHGLLMALCRSLVQTLAGLPWSLSLVAVAPQFGFDYGNLLSALMHPGSNLATLGVLVALLSLAPVTGVALQALIARALGTITPRTVSLWSRTYIRVALKTDLVRSAGAWLSGSLFWPVWLRAAGMRIGRGCEISTIIDVVPELVRIGPETFLADGIYLGGPRIQRGTATLAPVSLGTSTFLGNHTVVPAGQRLPDDVLVGVATVADQDLLREGTSWFGHPPFLLPRREIVEVDRALTHNPPWPRRINRLFWETLRFVLPVGPMVSMVAWTSAIGAMKGWPWPVFLFLGVPLITVGCDVGLCVLVLMLKWALLGKVRPGTHPLWSCWCSRWDFLYVAWAFLAAPVLTAAEGTLLLPFYLRAMGARIGKRVVLGRGFAQVVDPDLIAIGDGATVNALYQAHTFENRVLKIDSVRVGERATLAGGTVPLYGADVGAYTRVAPHSVIMKQERLRPGSHYEGVPTRQIATTGLPRETTAASHTIVDEIVPSE